MKKISRSLLHSCPKQVRVGTGTRVQNPSFTWGNIRIIIFLLLLNVQWEVFFVRVTRFREMVKSFKRFLITCSSKKIIHRRKFTELLIRVGRRTLWCQCVGKRNVYGCLNSILLTTVLESLYFTTDLRRKGKWMYNVEVKWLHIFKHVFRSYIFDCSD